MLQNNLQMTDLVPHTVVTKLSVPKSNGTWVGNELTSTIYLPVNATDAYKLFRKMKEDAMQRRAIWEVLYHVSGGIDTQQYLQGIAETEKALKSLEATYHFEAVSLVIVDKEATPKITNELFEDTFIADHYLKSKYGITIEDIQTKNIPSRLEGTRVFKQNWHTHQSVLMNTSMKPTDQTNKDNELGKIL